MDSSIPAKDEIGFLRMCHQVSNELSFPSWWWFGLIIHCPGVSSFPLSCRLDGGLDPTVDRPRLRHSLPRVALMVTWTYRRSSWRFVIPSLVPPSRCWAYRTSSSDFVIRSCRHDGLDLLCIVLGFSTFPCCLNVGFDL